VSEPGHNHVTRDIKERGKCPACDAYWDENLKRVREEQARQCDVFWGSHGCDLGKDHEGLHHCRDCCRPDDPAHMAAHSSADAEDYGADGCAGHWPYYGRRNMEGPDANLKFFRLDPAPSWGQTKLDGEFDRLAALRSE
jgi:hypothetical protein